MITGENMMKQIPNTEEPMGRKTLLYNSFYEDKDEFLKLANEYEAEGIEFVRFTNFEEDEIIMQFASCPPKTRTIILDQDIASGKWSIRTIGF